MPSRLLKIAAVTPVLAPAQGAAGAVTGISLLSARRFWSLFVLAAAFGLHPAALKAAAGINLRMRTRL